MPLNGLIRQCQVYKDLRTVWEEIDPAIGLQEMGQTIRDDARNFVEAGFPHKWHRWEHAKRLIIEHDNGDDPFPEGMEMANYVFIWKF